MPVQYAARVTYANGIAASDVAVQVFDRDQPGKSDDNLTSVPGKSDRMGIFTVEYDPSRYQDSSKVTVMVPRNPPYDWTLIPRTEIRADSADAYQPYLRFTYTQEGESKTFTADLTQGFQVYALPDSSPRRFLPSQHGWKFANAFSGYFLPFALPMLSFLGNPTSIYGLCGGMSAGALDMFLANRDIPNITKTPINGSPIQRYVYQRQLESFGLFGAVVMRFVEWMGLPDSTPQGTQKISWDEFSRNIQPRLDLSLPTPIAIQYVKWADTRDVFQNHQVLAYAYETGLDDRLSIHVYDPNYPGRDDVQIVASKVDVGGGIIGLSCAQHIGQHVKKMYGFFAMSYQPALPPLDI